EHEAAVPGEPEPGTHLGRERVPTRRGVEVQGHRLGRLAGSVEAVLDHAVLEEEVQAPGVLPGGVRVDLVPFEEDDDGALLREGERSGAAEQTSADDEDVAASPHARGTVSIPRLSSVSATISTSSPVSSRRGARTKPAGTPRSRRAVFMMAWALPNSAP